MESHGALAGHFCSAIAQTQWPAVNWILHEPYTPTLGDVMIQTVISCSLFFALRLVFAILSYVVAGDVISRLRPEDRISWSARMVSIVWDLTAAAVGLQIVLCDGPANHDVIRGVSALPNKVFAVELGYLAYDVLIETWKGLAAASSGSSNGSVLWGRVPILFHHALFAGFAFLYWHFRFGDFFVGLVALMALPTPFIHISWYLKKLGKDRTFLSTVNGVVLVGATFVCRLVVFPWYGVYRFAEQRGITSVPDLYLAVPQVCWGCSLAVWSLSAYWFLRIARIAARETVLRGPKQKGQ